MTDKATGPRRGPKIVDISTVVAGPFAAGLLGDYGAEVIKVEMPGAGDTLRALAPHKGGTPLCHPSSGNGTSIHVAMEELKTKAGMRILHVPYQGSPPAMNDLVAGTVQVAMDTVTVTKPHIDAGRLRLIAVSTLQRLAFLPDMPTIAQQGFPGRRLGALPRPSTAAEFSTFLKSEDARWSKVVAQSGIKAE